jgi:hypothetical protein
VEEIDAKVIGQTKKPMKNEVIDKEKELEEEIVHKGTSKSQQHVETQEIDKEKEPELEQFQTTRILENTLSWGDQPIINTFDEVANMDFIACNH